MRLPSATLIAALACLSCEAAAQGVDRPTPRWRREAPAPDPVKRARDVFESPIPAHARISYFNELGAGAGAGGATNAFEIRPDFPIGSEDVWGVLNRTALPFVFLSDEVAGDTSEFGLGDARYSFLLTRRAREPRRSAYGRPRRKGPDVAFGPAFTFPTATDSDLGFDAVTIGPEVAMDWTRSVWRFGFTAVQRWSVGGERNDVSELTLEPYGYLNLDGGWYAFSRPTLRADWRRDSDRISAPVGAGMGRVLDMGEGRPLGLEASAYTTVTDGPLEPNWVLRFQAHVYFGR